MPASELRLKQGVQELKAWLLDGISAVRGKLVELPAQKAAEAELTARLFTEVWGTVSTTSRPLEDRLREVQPGPWLTEQLRDRALWSAMATAPPPVPSNGSFPDAPEKPSIRASTTEVQASAWHDSRRSTAVTGDPGQLCWHESNAAYKSVNVGLYKLVEGHDMRAPGHKFCFRC